MIIRKISFFLLIFAVIIQALVIAALLPENETPIFWERGVLTIRTLEQEHSLKVEIAENKAQKTRGLMYQRYLPEDTGMIFFFPAMQKFSMWMKNTYIPLDMLFFNEEMEIVCLVENAEPHSEKMLGCDAPSLGVVELNAGLIEKWNIKKGDSIALQRN